MNTRIPLMSAAAVWLAAFPLLADVREGLVAYWPMDSASSAYPMSTPDVVAGNDLLGPYMDSSTALGAGRFGLAVTFIGDVFSYLYYVNAGLDSGLPVANSGSWTWALWVKGASGQANQTTYFCETSSVNSSGNPRFAMEGNGADKTRYFIRDINGTVKNQVVGSRPTLDDTWHHVAYTYDAVSGLFLAYVDGQPDCTNTFAYAKELASWDQVAIGALARNDVRVPFAGSVDDVAVWARALTQAEIQDVIDNSIATPVPPFKPVITANPAGAVNLLPGDTFTLTGTAYGTRPLSYVWTKDGFEVPGATARTLTLSSVAATDSGQYRLVVANAAGSATSAPAVIAVSEYGSPNLTNGLMAYWPLDVIAGVKTPDLVSAYDMTLGGSPAPTLVPGRWGQAMSFAAASSQFARVIYPAGAALPAYSRSNFTVSFWAKAPVASQGWAFAEASTVNNNAAFTLGMLGDARLDMYVRTDGAGVAMNHVRSASTSVWDDEWHHIAWVQHDAGGTPRAQLYIDGALDAATLSPAYPITPNNTALGAYARATPNVFYTGLVDEVAIWERPLSPDELALLATTYITNPPSRLTPLAVGAFRSDLPAVAQGDATVLRWDVPANATQVLIDPLGDVTSQTVSGVGATNVTLTATTAFVLSVSRGAERVTATNIIRVVDGVAAHWRLLDNFDAYAPGSLAAGGWWVDIGGGSSVSVVAPSGCNRMIRTTLGTSGAYLPLRNLTVVSNQSCTLFFRMIPTGNPGGTLRQYLGLTDRLGNFPYQYTGGNIGPAVQPTVNDPLQNPGDWLLAARSYLGSPLTFAPDVLEVGAVYSIWLDVTNVALPDLDMFSVHVQKEGDAERTTVFADFVSDRDPESNDPLTGGVPTDNLGRIYLCGNSDTDSALFDDFYLSQSGYNASMPRRSGYSGPAPTLQLDRSGNQWHVVFQGTLQETTSVNGDWSDVPDAASPYPLSTTSDKKFYRAVCD
jgi:hypothetical protein